MRVMVCKVGPAVVALAVCMVFCAAAQGAKEDTPASKAGEVKVNPKDGAEMVWVPPGEFLMGSSDEEIAQLLKEHPDWKAEWLAREKPQRKVNLDGYWIYKREVTVAQYRRFCQATERKMPEAPSWGWKDDHPIVNVSWADAAAYAKWAGGTLPTEAQWEKAARGADGRRYPWGKQWPPPKGAGNFADKALTRESPALAGLLTQIGLPPLSNYDDGYAYTAPVGSFPAGASPYGALDMAGNVWEWCADWYGKGYYENAPSSNPQGPTTGSYRVLRGGSWYSDDYAFTPGAPTATTPRSTGTYYYYLGFRLARSGG